MSEFTEKELEVGVGAYDKLLQVDELLDDEWTDPQPEEARKVLNKVLTANESDNDE